MNEIMLIKKVGSFAENKDLAREIRLKEIVPALENKEQIILNFQDIDGATQSFIHALLSDVIRKYGGGALDKIFFKNCNKTVKKIISIVVEYMQEIE